MFKRELKINFKSFILWFVLLSVMYFAVFAIYPSIVNQEEIKSLNEMMNAFPKELLIAFNMDLSTIDHAYGWLKTEGFVFVLLIVGCYASILGSTIVLKEENDKTIEYLHSLPISRSSIFMQKVYVSLLYILLLVVLLTLVNYFGLKMNGEFDELQFLYLSLTPLLSALPLFSINLFLSTFTHKSKKMIGTSLGITFASYILQIISTLSSDVEFIKYLSVYTLSDVRNVIINTSIDYNMVLISIIITVLFIILSLLRYCKKEMM